MKPLALALALLLPALRASAEDKSPPPRKIEGFVIDSSKVLQADVEIALAWTLDGSPAAEGAFKTDAKGHFEHTFKKWPGNVVLVAFDADRKHACLLAVDGDAAKKPLTLVLGPVTHVKGKVVSTEASIPAAAKLTVALADGGAVVGTATPDDKGFALTLPHGKYKLTIKQDQMRPIEKDLDLTAKSDIDAGELKLVPFPVAVGLGKTLPPFHAAFVRGGKPDLQISDYKGKWVLVLFWGSWCNTSSTGWMSNLVQFHERLKGTYSNFQILSYHDATAKSFDEMEEKLAKHGKLGWNPRELPFPLLLDAPEHGTIADWGVSGEPTVLLFDTEGRFVKQARDFGMLEAALKGELK